MPDRPADDTVAPPALRREQHLAAIVDSAHDAIVSKDLAGPILTWNEAATRMYGYTADEAVGQPIDIVIPLDEQRRAEELGIRASIARGERIEHYETIRRHKSGTLIEVSLSISPVRNPTGAIVGAAGIARRRLFGANGCLASIVDISTEAILSLSLDGTIMAWNRSATRMYGYTAEEAIGRPIDVVVPLDERRRAEELGIRSAAVRGERVERHETVRRRRDGVLVDVCLSIAPVRDAAGRIVAVTEISRDISDRRRLGTGLDGTTHDLKTPMRNILMNAQEAARLVTDGAHQMARIDELLGRIVANSVWMNQRTEGLLRASSLHDRPGRWTVDAGRVFDETYEMLRSVDPFVGAATVHRGELPAVASDKVLLGLLFQNLLLDACRHGRTGESVVVSVTADRYERGWTFAIRASEWGDRLDQIFEPHGLGDSRRIVEWHGGRIWAASEPGHGTTLCFTIPDLSGAASA
jgi:PAS domain S-box-containing protein